MENQNIQIQQVEQVKKIKKVLTRAQEIERSIVKKFKKDIWRNFTKAINEYQMIQDVTRLQYVFQVEKILCLWQSFFRS